MRLFPSSLPFDDFPLHTPAHSSIAEETSYKDGWQPYLRISGEAWSEIWKLWDVFFDVLDSRRKQIIENQKTFKFQ
jgi:hypothetical protein